MMDFYWILFLSMQVLSSLVQIVYSQGVCNSSPCQNFSPCIQDRGGYICRCQIGWMDANCATQTGQTCGSNFFDTSGVIQSPNYPANYNSGSTCLYLIRVANAQKIDFTVDAFNIEQDKDFFGYGGGPLADYNIAQGQFTGNSAPDSFSVTDNEAWIIFTTDINAEMSGWRITYRADVDECTSDPCKNAGTCQNLINRFMCRCVIGWTGILCESDINECISNPCFNGGICVNGVAEFRCNCVNGYTGIFCTEDIDECASSPCNNGATCVDNQNSFTCLCESGFVGPVCDINVNECSSNPCQNSGICQDGINGYTCQCQPGWEGANCELDTDECASDPCMNGASCFNRENSYHCQCASGWQGLNCDDDFNECSSNPCFSGGTCNNHQNYFNCTCPSGWTGILCEADFDECISSPCRNQGTCLNLRAQFRCLCLDGFEGEICADDIDECSSSPCLNGQCVDSINRYQCVCNAGFMGDNCETEIVECDPSPCANGGTCTDLIDQYVCICPPGWMGSTCRDDIDECTSNPCNNSVTCLNLVNSFDCICQPGYEGVTCNVDTNECLSNPCRNGGQCIDQLNRFECSCLDGYAGPICAADVNECSSLPCQNGGQCINDVNRYVCDCIDGFQGINCETDIDECSSSPCENGATCTNQVAGFFCTCTPGWRGSLCSIDINECSSNPCLNGATCENLENDYNCLCAPGWFGDNCINDFNECLSSPCLNGATCFNLTNRYLCLCPLGWQGTDCELDVTNQDSGDITISPPSPRTDMVIPILVVVLAAVGLIVFICLVLVVKRRKKIRGPFPRGPPENLHLAEMYFKKSEDEIREVDEVLRDKEISPEQVTIESKLGEGEFGIVHKGHLKITKNGKTKEIVVAVKTTKVGSYYDAKEDLLNEMKLIAELGDHPNILHLIACCSAMEPYYIITEFMQYGDLLRFLQKCRETGDEYRDPIYTVGEIQQLVISRDIAKGMAHIQERRFYHGDLAARNVLVGDQLSVKISDFGLADDIYTRGYKRREVEQKIPIKWCSLETILNGICSSQGDVWSFGVLLYEVFTLGGTPYPGVAPRFLVTQLKQGYRMEQPNGCPDDTYKLMRRCWETDPNDRPRFQVISEELAQMLMKRTDYVEFELTADSDGDDDTADRYVQDPTAAIDLTKLAPIDDRDNEVDIEQLHSALNTNKELEGHE